MFRINRSTEIEAIKIENNEDNISNLNLTEDNYTIDENNQIILNNKDDIANALGPHFEKINAKKSSEKS